MFYEEDRSTGETTTVGKQTHIYCAKERIHYLSLLT